MISQLDVAKAAGVSTTTASLALNNHPRVSAKTTLNV
jgi:DNA-binding LacI/PurR family transcriptional regulator